MVYWPWLLLWLFSFRLVEESSAPSPLALSKYRERVLNWKIVDSQTLKFWSVSRECMKSSPTLSPYQMLGLLVTVTQCQNLLLTLAENSSIPASHNTHCLQHSQAGGAQDTQDTLLSLCCILIRTLLKPYPAHVAVCAKLLLC